MTAVPDRLPDPPPAFQIDDDPRRIDRAAVVEFLTTRAYWGRWRTPAQIAEQLDASWRVAGAYLRAGGAMVGFARAVSDGVAVAYLADVFVEPAHRGVGIGTALVAALVDTGPGAELRWMLHTSDAHTLYTRFGFAPPDATYLERPAAPGRRGMTAVPGGPPVVGPDR